jgi:hypothetical protein
VLPLLVLAGLVAPLIALQAAAATDVKLTRADDRIRVEVGGKLFTEYVFKGMPRPIMYPVLAADGTEMTRNYPMKKDVPGEAADHPHHRSLWFTHGNVNGVDFWAENGTKDCGKILNESVEHSVKGGVGTIKSRNEWVGADGTVHMTDETTISFRGSGDARFIDYQVTLKAPGGQAGGIR